MRTIDKIITKVDVSRGAPMGRANIDDCPKEIVNGVTMSKTGKLFDCAVPMSNDGAYDRSGSYWGLGGQLRVQYNKNLTFVRFYRVGDNI